MDMPMFEVQVSLTQVQIIASFLQDLKAKPAAASVAKKEEESKDDVLLDAKELDSLVDMKEDFAERVLSQNPQLM